MGSNRRRAAKRPSKPPVEPTSTTPEGVIQPAAATTLPSGTPAETPRISAPQISSTPVPHQPPHGLLRPVPDVQLEPAAPKAKAIQAVCSGCCQPFTADPQLDRSLWQCPHCGPELAPLPQQIVTPPMPRWRQFFHSQVHRPGVHAGAVVLCFAMFLGGIHVYLARNPAAVFVGGKSATEIAVLTRGITPEEELSEATTLAATARDNTSGNRNASLASDDNVSESDLENQTSPATSSTVPARNVSHRRTVRPGSNLAITGVDGAISIRQFVRYAPQLYGKDLRMPCRLISISENVAGSLPNHFKLNGETVRVPSPEEGSYLRLVVSDNDSEEFKNVFIERHKSGADVTQWLRQGDWLILQGTPGMRYDRLSESTAWGFVVTKVSELTATSELPLPSSPSFSPTATRPVMPGRDWQTE